MTLPEEQGGFDLEKARASIAHYRIENPSNVDTESALKELVDQANLAEDALTEIERLRARESELEARINTYIDIGRAPLENCYVIQQILRDRLDRIHGYLFDHNAPWKNGDGTDDIAIAYMKRQAARIKELEEALVDARGRLFHQFGCIELDPPNADDRRIVRELLQAEGKIGPDARPRSWQITEERMRAIRLSEELAWDCKVVDVLRAMLQEAGI